MKRTKMKRILPLLLSAALTLGCVTTSFAVDIDFGDGTNAPSYSNGNAVENAGTITTNDATSNVTGNGGGWSLSFTDPNASVGVQGNVTVGGIGSTGDLTITGGAGDTLTSNGSGNTAGIDTVGDLTIDGGVTVNANGGSDFGSAGPGVSVGGDLNVNNGVLKATGGTESYSGQKEDGLNVNGGIYVGGIQDTTDYNGQNSVTLSAVTKLINPPNPNDPRIQPVLTVTQTPEFAVVGQEVTISVTISPFDWGEDASVTKYITLQFVDASGKVWHTVSDVPITFDSENSGIAQITYIYNASYFPDHQGEFRGGRSQ